jgi:hypothetical protein
MKKDNVREANKTGSMAGALETFRRSIARFSRRDDDTETAVPGLSLFWRSEPAQPYSALQ